MVAMALALGLLSHLGLTYQATRPATVRPEISWIGAVLLMFAASLARALSEIGVEPWGDEQALAWWSEGREEGSEERGPSDDSAPLSPRPSSLFPAT
jgi:hypothetical protein